MLKDSLTRYIFNDMSVRGELVQLTQTYNDVLENHHYPLPVKNLLGELLVATSLLTATLKFKGSITVQLQGDGPVTVMVVNGTHEQKLRGIARVNGDVDENDDIHQLMGKGILVITITPEKGERYQGIVALDGKNLSEILENYFIHSEQLQTRIWLRQDDTHAAGMLLQILPAKQLNQYDFEHLEQLTDTIKNEELFSLEPQEILYRLYHQESVQLFPSQGIEFVCTCSRKKCEDAIVTLPKDEVADILKKEGKISMNCDYCGTHYEFDTIDVAGLYKQAMPKNTQKH